MRDAVIVGAIRTPTGRRKGALAGVNPVDLSAHVLRALIARLGIEPGLVDDVYWGCVTQVGEQSWNVGRNAALAAGWPESVPGVTIDRQCGSSQQALHFAAAAVISGQAELVVAGGVESMSRVPLGANAIQGPGKPFGPLVRARYGRDDDAVPFSQGVGAELIAERWELSRAALDSFSLASHAKAARATDDGEFDGELAPIDPAEVAGSMRLLHDEGIRRDTTPEALGALSTPFLSDGVITAGSSSQISDGAAALLVTTSERAKSWGLRPMVRVHTAVVAADDPVIMLTAPIPATAKALAKAGLGLGQIGTFEVNEAFASVPLAWLAETGADPQLTNPQGGAIALGHPLGASGARLATTLVHRMVMRQIRYGLQTMCEGGGMANATIFELVS